ncbi:MAG: FecR domain-containing protein [Gammaproteobacteria bacterium]|nr:FecR domain-containing protein [Gammaproteobacteria bacterium]
MIFKHKFSKAACVLAINLFSGSLFAHEWIYTTRPGDTLWDLTEKHLTSVGYTPHVQKLNKIKNPENIPAGTRIKFPISWLKVQPEKARVVFASGAGTITDGEDKSEKALAVDLELQTHDVLKTEEGGSAVIQFADGSRLTVRENTSIEMDTLSAYGVTGMVDTRVRLTEGRVKADTVTATGAASRYEIQTRAAVTAVRGTEFRISAFGEVGRVEILEGKVRVTGSDAKNAQDVHAGFGIVAKVGETPEAPRELLGEPDVSALPAVIEKDPAKFEWPDQDGAKGYRVQVAANDSFDELMLDTLTDEAKIKRVEFDNDGDFFMRLRGVDEVDLEGKNAMHAFTVNARPTAPLTLEPTPEAVLRVPQPPLSWTESLDIAGYQVQLASIENFASTLFDESVADATEFTPPDELAPGTYYWRVAARDNDGSLGPFGETRVFTYTPPSPVPDLAPPEVSDEGMVLFLPELDEGQQFIVQVARDTDFEKMVADEQLAESKFVLKPKKGGRHYIRTAVVESDGYVGDYGNTQEVKIPRVWPETLAKFLISFGIVFGL